VFSRIVFLVPLIGAPMLLQVTTGDATKVDGPTDTDRAKRALLDALIMTPTSTRTAT